MRSNEEGQAEIKVASPCNNNELLKIISDKTYVLTSYIARLWTISVPT